MNSEDDTFDALRRVPYQQACAEYTIAAMAAKITYDMTEQEEREIIDAALKPHGWSFDELNNYWEKNKEQLG